MTEFQISVFGLFLLYMQYRYPYLQSVCRLYLPTMVLAAACCSFVEKPITKTQGFPIIALFSFNFLFSSYVFVWFIGSTGQFTHTYKKKNSYYIPHLKLNCSHEFCLSLGVFFFFSFLCGVLFIFHTCRSLPYIFSPSAPLCASINSSLYIGLLSHLPMTVSLTLRITHAGRADGPAVCLLSANIEDLESQQIMRA